MKPHQLEVVFDLPWEGSQITEPITVMLALLVLQLVVGLPTQIVPQVPLQLAVFDNECAIIECYFNAAKLRFTAVLYLM